MLIKDNWKESEIIDGIVEIKFSSWKYFSTYIHDEMLDFPHYIWRGQASTEWLLEPTLYREIKKLENVSENIMEEHLENFKYSVRGRRGKSPILLTDDDEWWSLGQHYGLATPLLDWSYSPFVAAFFAFSDKKEYSNHRAIYSLNIKKVLRKAEKKYIKTQKSKYNEIKSIRPLLDENARLVNQGGEFVKFPFGTDIETLVRELFKGNNEDYILLKLLVPNNEREICLRYLNKMNINHLTLFPDINGAAAFTNQKLMIDKY